MISERIGAGDGDPDRYARETRALELGLARRKVELYERMLTEAAAGDRPAANDGELRDVLAGARLRLAELEAAEAAAREGLSDGPQGFHA